MNLEELARKAAAHKRAAVRSLKPTQAAARERATELWNSGRDHKRQAKQVFEEREIVNGHHLDLFPTPADLADRMVSIGDRPGGKWLEPSAGTGRIAQAILDAGHTPDCVELNYNAVKLLQERGFNVVHSGDFLEFHGAYDVIIMNPPFSNLQDIDHVKHAYSLLNPGGRIVAIMSPGPFFRKDKKCVQFRNWVHSKLDYSEDLPAGTFKASGTMVAAKLVILDKSINP